MKLNRFFDILSNVHSVKEEEITDLQQITEIYPFFQAAQILYAKALHNANHYTFQSDIKKIAAVIYDRKQLFQILHQEDYTDLADVNESKKEALAFIQNKDGKKLVSDNNYNSDNIDHKQEKTTSNVTEPKANEDISKKEEHFKISETKLDFIVSETVNENVDKHHFNSNTESVIWKKEQTQKIALEIPKKNEEISDEKSKTEATKNLNPLDQPTDSELYQSEIAKAMVTAYAEKDILEVNKIDTPKPSRNLETEDVSESPSDAEKVEITQNHSSFANWLKQINGSKTEDNVQNTSQIEENRPKEVSIIETKLKQTEIQKETIEDESDLEKLKKSRLVKEHQEIIDKIIKIEPKITKPRSEFFNSANKAKDSVQEDVSIVSETLARIYAMQGNLSKAIKTYEILSLKFPEKSAYFAALIRELKINNK
jgi:hypothetical protein